MLENLAWVFFALSLHTVLKTKRKGDLLKYNGRNYVNIILNNSGSITGDSFSAEGNK